MPGSVNERSVRAKIIRNFDLYLLLIPVIAYFLIFKYIPMYGVLIAFQRYNPTLGILGSKWIGFRNFARFFNSYEFGRVLTNTVTLSFYELAVSFPGPIVLALIINEITRRRFKKVVQTITYAPHFISTVVIVGMLIVMLSPRNGIINHFVTWISGQPVNFLGTPGWFKTIYVLSDVWQHAGWGSIIYIATLASVDPQLYDAAFIDGCSKFRKLINIDVPVIIPTATILLILRCGRIMDLAFQKVLLMQNPLNLSASDIIQTYVYRFGLLGGQFSFAAAVGLFNNIINLILLLSVNAIARRFSETSLW